MEYKYNVAISFAGEDRNAARQIAQGLETHGLKVFYDEFEQANLWGKDLYEYLADVYSNQAQFCIMLISKHYAEKAWTTHERKNAQARAFRENKEYILPVKLDDTTLPAIPGTIGYLDLRQLSVEEIVSAVLAKMEKSKATAAINPSLPLPSKSEEQFNIPGIPIPKVKRKISRLEKDKYLKEAFTYIKEYFNRGLQELKKAYSEVDIDFTEIHNFKFVSKVYVEGDLKTQCKIWIGGMMSDNQIAYSEGQFDLNNDNSLNDWITVADDGHEIFLQPSGMGFHYGQTPDKKLYVQEAAEYLWKRFMALLEF